MLPVFRSPENPILLLLLLFCIPSFLPLLLLPELWAPFISCHVDWNNLLSNKQLAVSLCWGTIISVKGRDPDFLIYSYIFFFWYSTLITVDAPQIFVEYMNKRWNSAYKEGLKKKTNLTYSTPSYPISSTQYSK